MHLKGKTKVRLLFHAWVTGGQVRTHASRSSADFFVCACMCRHVCTRGLGVLWVWQHKLGTQELMQHVQHGQAWHN